jgi:protein-L-isoaspartate(D-aspartate) O-methyltransferase
MSTEELGANRRRIVMRRLIHSMGVSLDGFIAGFDGPARPSSADELLCLLRRYISDERVLAAIASVPRELFVAPEMRGRAWHNSPLPIGAGQTISQPLVVARMCEALGLCGEERILDVGTGSGYHAAILARLGRSVVSIERDPGLSQQARGNLVAAGIENVTLIIGDGRKGHLEQALYDAINVAAAATRGLPQALLEQLTSGGRLIAPVAYGIGQRLILAERIGTDTQYQDLGPVQFVPLGHGQTESTQGHD